MKTINAGLGPIIFALAVTFGLCSCDDIDRPMEDPFLKRAPGRKERVDSVLKQATRMDMEKIFFFIRDTRQTARKRAEISMLTREHQPDRFETVKKKFHDQTRTWDESIRSRIEALGTSKHEYPKGHPAHVLNRALHLLRQEINSYDRDFYGRESFKPGLDRELLEQLAKAHELIDQYQDPARPPIQLEK